MRVGSLFAGIGGFDLGLERAGFEIAWQVEIDPYCQRVLAKHWPHVKRYGDIKAIDWGTLEPVDLMCGGFPCQPFSLAGQRRGTADDRYLWPAMLGGIQQLKPTWIIGENVPGLVGPVLDTVLSDLEAAGYEVQTLAIPACAFDAPHIRQRLWIIANSNEFRAHNSRHGTGEVCGERSSETQLSSCNGDVPNAECQRRQAGPERSGRTEGADVSRLSTGTNLADDASESDREPVSRAMQRQVQQSRKRAVSAAMANSDQERWNGRAGEFRERRRGESADIGRWEPEPELGRVAHGIPHRVDRIRGLGNAIVPQIAEWLGRKIMKVSHA